MTRRPEQPLVDPASDYNPVPPTCPLLAQGLLAKQGVLGQDGAIDPVADCLGEGCAWWLTKEKMCAVAALGADAASAVADEHRQIDRYEETH